MYLVSFHGWCECVSVLGVMVGITVRVSILSVILRLAWT